ncbi:Pleckstrin homology domain-containing family G member 7 [Anabarilius grahami]|uniref:Pleckstrin homology domain-containing family G member 7 n=1 Tax=Anabarilius grahami TaxID=495550 RepID=A0A3N0YB99_ANAGA|nr:Pleckstrin homology domain-containing family G member 7 [Anabarilius grahami]
MTELNYAFISENGKEVDKTLDWSCIDWHARKTVKATDAQTQTQCVQSEDKDTQTASPFIMRIDLGRTSSRLRYGSLTESDGIPAHLFQFDRQAPARISTSPTLRRMRSMRISYREPSKLDGPLGEESPTPTSPISPLFRLKSPLAVQLDGETGNFESSVIHGKMRSHRSKTLDNGVICKSKEFRGSKEPVSDGNESSTDDNEQTKGKTRSVADIDKCLAGIQIQEWRDTDFQTYKDMSLEDFLRGRSELEASENPKAYRKQEAIWELFTSECVYFLDQLMVLKEVFLTTLSELQMRDCLQDIDSWRLFANLNELCLVSFGFLTSLFRVIKEMWTNPDSNSTQSLLELLRKAFGESICHCLQKYCLNYSTAIFYLDSLKLREDFGSFVKWCERNEQCRRLQLKDLLVIPLQRFTRYPLLLKNIGKRSCSEAEENTIQSIVDLVDRAISSGLPNSFIIMHQNRYQQCIGVFILQAQTESMKVNMRSNMKAVTRSSLCWISTVPGFDFHPTPLIRKLNQC